MADTRGQQVENTAALKTYCEKKIQHINKLKKLSIELHQKRNCTAIKSVEPISEQCVPVHFICTLWMKTFREEIRKGAKQEFHDPSRCGACLAKQADLATNNFIRTKRNQLQAQLLEDKIQTHLYSRDTVCLLGELLRDMPKYSDDPSQIWQRLLSAEHRQTLQ